VVEPPALRNGHITFGSFNAFYKLNPQILGLWAEILRRLPNARLHVLAPESSDAVKRLFEQSEVPLDRLTLVSRRPRDAYLALYNEIDITLDPFPYNGHTTSIDSLWMGVPVVTMTGATSVSRAGSSLLNNVRLTEWIADSPARYVDLAASMAADVDRLAALRRELRERLQASPVMDERGYARDLEKLYRQMWRQWAQGSRG
jgi:predicted O-linked N-acetylglucosamine transferase (SPINDLY family)